MFLKVNTNLTNNQEMVAPTIGLNTIFCDFIIFSSYLAGCMLCGPGLQECSRMHFAGCAKSLVTPCKVNATYSV